VRQYRPFLELHAMDVVMVEVLWQGFSAARKVADLAETDELNVASHNYNGHLSTLAAVDLGADTIYAISASQPSIEMSGGSLAQADVLGLCLTVPVSAVYRRSIPASSSRAMWRSPPNPPERAHWASRRWPGRLKNTSRPGDNEVTGRSK
jgi:hypothetical protein